ncbi:ComF family protein [Pseudobutyrivibrio sp.]|uniref:ComF family protein n=1 Tax=Pseudobutyrivibrio sp. TaxID=2014367 RepID=UPI0025FCF777|nr:ComF family protein [Pseudobutyrivibrio sp.]MBR5648387.1 ComF family protein [Pseudobutyrivibrio sp.]
MTRLLKIIINSVVGLLYPKQCMSCGKVLLKIEKELGFCGSCLKGVKLVGDNCCLKCGKPIDDSIMELCDQCQQKNHYFTQNKGVFVYEGPVKKSMYLFKYSNKRSSGKFFASYAVKKYGKWIKNNKIEAIVPVPMYKSKMKRRGYNQAEVFANQLSKLTNIPVVTDVITRNRDTVAMKQLRGAKRKKNLLNAFKVPENIVQFRKVLVVDDIYTTGTTIDEVSKALKGGGITEVYGLCICIGKM